MEVLVLDGKSYVKASKAARELGYATDYVGQLCRSGQVDAHLIGRTWYVNQDQLGTHRSEKKRMSRVKAREQARKAIEEHRTKSSEKQKDYRNIDIQYESDSEDLIPEVRKLKVGANHNNHPILREEDDEEETTVENKGKKVLMSGDLAVVDVTDASQDEDAIVLTPGRIRSGTITVSPRNESGSIDSVVSEVDSSDTEAERPTTFEDKLVSLESVYPPKPDALEETTANIQKRHRVNQVGSVVPYILFVLFVIVLTSVSLMSSQIQNYILGNSSISTAYDVSVNDFISKIQLEI